MGVCRVVVVIVAMVMVMRMFVGCLQAAFARTKRGTKRALGDIRSRRARALAFHMVVVAFLDGANLCLKAKDLSAIFTHGAIGRGNLTHELRYPFGESFQNLGVISKIARFDETDLWMGLGNTIGKAVNPVDQDA